MKASRNGFSELQSFWMMGTLAILPVVEIRPPIFANIKELTRGGLGDNCTWGCREVVGRGCRVVGSGSAGGIFPGESTCGEGGVGIDGGSLVREGSGGGWGLTLMELT